MTYNRGCCTRIYTTRQYDPGGNTLWLGNYQDGGTQDGGMQSITCMAADATQIYCGHPRQTKSGVSWNVTALDISTGAINWKYDIGSGKQPYQMRIDQSGNLVVMLYLTYNPSVAQTETFYVLNTSGSLVATKTFTQNRVSQSDQVSDFIITSAGDYHLTAYRFTGSAAIGIYEWLSPQSSGPTFTQSTTYAGSVGSFTGHSYNYRGEAGNCIERFGGQDYVGLGTNGTYGLGFGFQRMIAKSGVATASGECDLQSYWQYTLSVASNITAAGTNQGTATPIPAHSVQQPIVYPGAGAGVLLPSASLGDILTVTLTTTTANTVNVYPQSGGAILLFDGTQLAVNAPLVINKPGGTESWTLYYAGSNNWMARKNTELLSVFNLTVDGSGSIYTASPAPAGGYSGLMRKHDSNGTLLWAKGATLASNVVAVDDTATYCYSAGSNASCTVLQRDATTGVRQWGHLHLQVSGRSGIYYDTAADTITTNGLPKSTSTDASFVTPAFN